MELKQSYATKNFSLRDGLLEIEKNYRDFIHQSEDVEVRSLSQICFENLTEAACEVYGFVILLSIAWFAPHIGPVE